ncbi:MAG: Cna B-type domain-containing protein [Eubacterium sp.]|nr:Cna B-type domain-containing protein [Eubacterium sp.]
MPELKRIIAVLVAVLLLFTSTPVTAVDEKTGPADKFQISSAAESSPEESTEKDSVNNKKEDSSQEEDSSSSKEDNKEKDSEEEADQKEESKNDSEKKEKDDPTSVKEEGSSQADQDSSGEKASDQKTDKDNTQDKNIDNNESNKGKESVNKEEDSSSSDKSESGNDRSAAKSESATEEKPASEYIEQTEETTARKTLFEYKDKTMAVEARISPDSRFIVDDSPADSTELHLEGDTRDKKLFSELIKDYEGEVRTVDLSFCDKEGETAEQVEGNTSLTLTIKEKDKNAVINNVEVFSCSKKTDGDDLIERIDDIEIDEKKRTVEFDAGELCSYAVRYTVDYYYEGKEYHMPGGSTMLLSELFNQLSIKRDAADVERIDFTNDSLISFSRYDDETDWVIKSLKPFNSTEKMTITFNDGYKMVIEITDDQNVSVSSDLEDFLSNWKITVGDTVFSDDTVDDDTVIEFKAGMQYSLELNFAERSGLQFDTPETNPPDMLFQLPDAFVVPSDFQMALNVNLGRKGVLADNIVSVIQDTGADGKTHSFLKLVWNWQDTTHWAFFRDSSQAKLKITINGVFSDEEPHVLSINGKDVAIRKEDLHNAKVNKEGSYDKDTGIIDYTVTVTSDGTTSDITLTDTMGSALTYLVDGSHNGGIVFEAANSINSAGTTPQITQKTGNSFNVVIPAMNDGDCLVFKYSASVDYAQIAISGNPSFEETGNTAQIYGDSYRLDNTAIYHETNIEFSDLEKNVINKRRETINGNYSYILTWEVETNKRAQYPLADTDITDTISPSIQSFSRYYGDGVLVRCYTADNILQETRQLSWEDLRVDLANDVTWTYHIPETDPLYRYVLTYDTIVYMDNQTETVVAENTAEGKGGVDSDRAVLPIPGNSGIGVTKKATNVDSTHVTWEITLTVSGASLNYQRLVLHEHSGTKTVNNVPTWYSDSLPGKWINNSAGSGAWYKESLQKVEVVGLEENETFLVKYGRTGDSYPKTSFYPDQPGDCVLERNFADATSQWGSDYFTLEFFKDPDRTQGGLCNPGGDSPSRTITVRLSTEFPESWAAKAREYTLSTSKMDSSIFSHVNWIAVETPDSNGNLVTRAFDTDKFEPMPPCVYKTVLETADTTTVQYDYKKKWPLNYPDCKVKSSSSSDTGAMPEYQDLPLFPCFRYQVLVTGIKYDEPLVIEENFDTSLMTLMTSDDFQGGKKVMTYNSNTWSHTFFPKVFGTKNYGWISSGQSNYNGTEPNYATYGFGYDNRNYYRKAEDNGCTLEKTETGFRVTINSLFKDPDGNLFPYYGIDYYLVPKNLAALRQIEEMARANGQAGKEPKVNIKNTASARGISASANVKIGITNDFMPIDKTSETYLDLLDGNRIQLQDATVGSQTVRDTPDNVSAENIQRYVMKYRVVLNKGGERLNDGNDITAEDEYSSNLSVDFTSIRITTEPEEAASRVSYDYSGNIGYFTIPDETKVVIEYEATVLQSTAALVPVSNEVRMLQYKKAVEDYVEHGGAGGSSANTPGIFIKKYGSGHMEKGLNGATFQLYEYKNSSYERGDSNTEADWEPVILTKPDTHNAVFTTHDLTIGNTHYGNGYAEIQLTETKDGMNLEKGKVYGLREITTPVGKATNGDDINYQNPHSDNFYCYVFSICQDNETADYSNYIFLQDDTMTVRNTPESISLRLSKEINGNCSLSDTEKNYLHYQVFRKDTLQENQPAIYMPIMTEETDQATGQSTKVIDARFTGITYAQVSMNNGVEITGLTVANGATAGEYLLVEYGNENIMDNHPDWSWRGNYEWADGASGNFTNSSFTVYDENGENPQTVKGVEFTVTSQEIRDGESKSVSLTNAYNRDTINLTANKRWTAPSGSTVSWPSGKNVVFQLGTLDANNFFIPLQGMTITLDNTKDAHGEDVAGSAVFKNLPKKEIITDPDSGKVTVNDIRYAVMEIDSVQGYDTIYPGSAGNGNASFGSGTSLTIKNQVKSTSISVSKVWDGATIPDGASATFRLYSYIGNDSSAATWVNNVNDIVLDGIPDEGEGTFGEKMAWQADFTGLPEYDGNGVLLHYLVKEISCTPAGYEPEQDFAAPNGTITNKPATTVFTVTKRWSGTSGNTWPDGEKITLHLARKTRAGVIDNSFSADYTITASEIQTQEPVIDVYGVSRQAGSWSNGTLTVSDLPKYDGSGNEWLYYVTESEIKDSTNNEDLSGNYDIVYRDKNNYRQTGLTYSGGSVTNTRSTKQLTLSKTVSGNMGDRTKAFVFTIALRNSESSVYNGGVACIFTDQDDTASESTLTFVAGTSNVTLKHGESITLKDLPGNLQYTITENGTDAAGYQTTYKVNNGTEETGTTATGGLSSNPDIAFTNTRQVAIFTGVNNPLLVFAAAIPILLMGIILFLRRRPDDTE